MRNCLAINTIPGCRGEHSASTHNLLGLGGWGNICNDVFWQQYLCCCMLGEALPSTQPQVWPCTIYMVWGVGETFVMTCFGNRTCVVAGWGRHCRALSRRSGPFDDPCTPHRWQNRWSVSVPERRQDSAFKAKHLLGSPSGCKDRRPFGRGARAESHGELKLRGSAAASAWGAWSHEHSAWLLWPRAAAPAANAPLGGAGTAAGAAGVCRRH